ncbi:hypothetical protein [Campylobacter sp.]|uniref:hypothetical protein n=1 Tax=Campylobacter sp. TaxID=205 RepID=UPI0025C51F00|nr:hypothetical protein [Campylobacter sp.]
MFINSNISPYQNFTTHHFLKSERNNLNKIDDDTTQGNFVNSNSLYPNEHKITYASEFGFRIDERGFFEKDFNKSAKIPIEYDINIKSIREISKQLIKLDENLNYNKIDLPKLLNSYHNTLKTINPEFQSNNNSYLNKSQILKLNQGYSYDYDGKILKIYENSQDLLDAKDANKNLNTLMLDNKIGDFAFKLSVENTSSNLVIKPYLNKNAEVSKSGLFLNYIYNDIKEQNNNKTNFFLSPIELDYSSNMKFQKLMSGELKVDDYINENNKEKMSFDLYLYINGVDKNTTSEDKLSVFFQQYINYQHSINMQEFANSSSIYELYIGQVDKYFQNLKNDFNTKSENIDLEKINSQKENLDMQFLEHRKKQASINKILHSYLNAMA